MARKNIQRGSEEFELFTDFWNLYKNHAVIEHNESYIDQVIQAADEFYKNYNTEFSKELAAAFVNEIERKCRSEH